MSSSAEAADKQPTPTVEFNTAARAEQPAVVGVGGDSNSNTKAEKEVKKGAGAGAAAAAKEQPKESSGSGWIVETVKRFIPGLGSKEQQQQQQQPEATKAKRSRGSKNKSHSNSHSNSTIVNNATVDLKKSDDAAHDAASLEQAPARDMVPDSLLAPSRSTTNKVKPANILLNGNGDAKGQDVASDETVAETATKPRFSPAAIIQKRLKANNKKLVRGRAAYPTFALFHSNSAVY